MIIVFRVLWHGAWIVPLVLGRPYLAIALLLLVIVSYVKVFKFRQQLADAQSRGASSHETVALENGLKRWQSLTWLKNS